MKRTVARNPITNIAGRIGEGNSGIGGIEMIFIGPVSETDISYGIEGIFFTGTAFASVNITSFWPTVKEYTDFGSTFGLGITKIL